MDGYGAPQNRVLGESKPATNHLRIGSLRRALVSAPDDLDTKVGDLGRPEVTFWQSNLTFSFLVAFGEVAVIMGYLAVTPHGRHRVALWIMASAFLVLGLARLAVVSYVSNVRSLRLLFSFSWAVLTIGIIVAATMLDGSVESPLRSLLIVPVVFAGLLYPPAYVVGTALAATLGAILVTTTDPSVGVEWHFVIIDFAVLVGVGLCSLVASIGRLHLHDEADRLVAELEVLATTDPLTGCLNRRSFDAVCRSEVARALRHGRQLTLMMVDVDKLKRINDTSGHAAGDHALTAIAAVLKQTSRAGDAVARLGGDEFAILMPDTDPTGAIDRARRIRDELHAAPDIELTFSCGVCDLSSERTTVSGLSEVADQALYAAKRAGGDMVARPCDEGLALFETIQMTSSDVLAKGSSTRSQDRNEDKAVALAVSGTSSWRRPEHAAHPDRYPTAKEP